MSHITRVFARPTQSVGLVFTPRSTIHSQLLYLLRWFVLISSLSAFGLVQADSLIDINRADANHLAENLPGIGPAKAKAIVDYRTQHGAFTSIAALINVKGIGPATYEKIRRLLSVSQVNQLPAGVASSSANDSESIKAQGVVAAQTNNKSNREQAGPDASTENSAEEKTSRAVRALIDKARRQRSP